MDLSRSFETGANNHSCVRRRNSEQGCAVDRRWIGDRKEIELDQMYVDILVPKLDFIETRPVGTRGEAEIRAKDASAENT